MPHCNGRKWYQWYCVLHVFQRRMKYSVIFLWLLYKVQRNLHNCVIIIWVHYNFSFFSVNVQKTSAVAFRMRPSLVITMTCDRMTTLWSPTCYSFIVKQLPWHPVLQQGPTVLEYGYNGKVQLRQVPYFMICCQECMLSLLLEDTWWRFDGCCWSRNYIYSMNLPEKHLLSFSEFG